MTSSPEPQQSSLFFDVAPGERLHLRRIHVDPDAPAVLMVHGAMANARTFYSESGRGLGPWLARQGYDVFALDLRGRGRSTPKIGPQSTHGQIETIAHDLPAVIEEIARIKGGSAPLRIVAHSWGGVYVSSALVRRPDLARSVQAVVYFGSKRSIHVRNRHKFVEIDLVWNRLAPWAVRRYGYLPATRFRLGADDEPRGMIEQSVPWVRPSPWRDPVDGFDYAAAALQHGLPPTLYLAGGADWCRGHPDDVRRFQEESGPHRHRHVLLSRAAGFSKDYDHLGMLIDKAAELEVFPLVHGWLDHSGGGQ
jgi:pimeloyl-ACP methyl ester carboxylesterase